MATADPAAACREVKNASCWPCASEIRLPPGDGDGFESGVDARALKSFRTWFSTVSVRHAGIAARPDALEASGRRRGGRSRVGLADLRPAGNFASGCTTSCNVATTSDCRILRVGAVAAVAGALGQLVATVFEPDWSGEPGDAVRVVADSGVFIADRLVDLIGVLLTVPRSPSFRAPS